MCQHEVKNNKTKKRMKKKKKKKTIKTKQFFFFWTTKTNTYSNQKNVWWNQNFKYKQIRTYWIKTTKTKKNFFFYILLFFLIKQTLNFKAHVYIKKRDKNTKIASNFYFDCLILFEKNKSSNDIVSFSRFESADTIVVCLYFFVCKWFFVFITILFYSGDNEIFMLKKIYIYIYIYIYCKKKKKKNTHTNLDKTINIFWKLCFVPQQLTSYNSKIIALTQNTFPLRIIRNLFARNLSIFDEKKVHITLVWISIAWFDCNHCCLYDR